MDTSPRRNDLVFQLSLTELAFTVAFLLLLLSAVLVGRAERERDALRQALSSAQEELARAAAKEVAVDAIWTEIRQALAGAGVPELDRRLTELVRRVDAQARAEGLRFRLDALQTRLVALEAMRERLERAGPGGRDEAARRLIEDGIAALRGIESVTGAPPPGASPYATAAAIAADAQRAAALAAENAKLKGQIAHLRRHAGAEDSKGFGLPPCWVDASGRAQRLIEVTVVDAGLTVRPAWPAERSAQAAAIPGVAALVEQGGAMPIAQFLAQARPVYDWSRERDPECRHYAQVIVAATRVEAAVRGKNAVYALFYPAGPELLATGAELRRRLNAP